MKGYQISQYDMPLCRNGWLEVEANGKKKRIGITRVHLEEDVAKMVHRTSAEGEASSLVDVNRSGVPLMEVVSEPDICSPEEAREYLNRLRTIVQYLGISTGNMEEGSFRCDANISVRPAGTKEFLPKTEVKNMNSFRAVYRALGFEAERQVKVIENGERLIQETRGWVEEKGITVTQRSKEYAHDYRYFPEPDLPPLVCSKSWVDSIRARLPELPEARRERFMTDLGLTAYDAGLLTAEKPTADYFEECVTAISRNSDEDITRGIAKKAANWISGDFSRMLNTAGIGIRESQVTPWNLVELLVLVDRGDLSGPSAKAVFEEMFNTGKPAGKIVAEKGLVQIGDSSQIREAVLRALATNQAAVDDYHAGKEQALQFLTGQVMKLTRGRANPQMVREILIRELGGK